MKKQIILSIFFLAFPFFVNAQSDVYEMQKKVEEMTNQQLSKNQTTQTTATQPQTPQVTIFTASLYNSFGIPIMKDMKSLSKVFDNKISSIRIPEGFTIEVFDLPNYQGDSKVFASDWDETQDPDWNDRISSIKLRPKGYVKPQKAVATVPTTQPVIKKTNDIKTVSPAVKDTPPSKPDRLITTTNDDDNSTPQMTVIPTISRVGKYYALIIGNNIYQDPDINSLDQPVNDATKLYNELTTHYTFDPQNVTFLKNATYAQMIDALETYSNIITPDDNIIIFYAGHGYFDEAKNLGYWLPTDARKSSKASWLRNSTLVDYMSSIRSKHTLLIADACFSGGIFKTRSAFNDAPKSVSALYELTSKTAMTSGNLKVVPDKSVFMEYLLKRLGDNREKYLSSDKLFYSFRESVLNNSTTEPQYGKIQNAGDDGGEFILVRKDQ